MRHLFEWRQISLLYFLGLPFLFFPLYASFGTPLFLLVLIASLLFAFFYLSILFSKNPFYDALAWFYLIGYITYFSFVGNIQFSLFLFNLSNLLTWHFNKDKWTYRTISYALVLISVFIWTILTDISLDYRYFLWTMHGFGLTMLILGRKELRTEEAERKVMEQNASINLLTAENERNRIGRDLHDTLGHVFAMMTLKTELALKQLDKGELAIVAKELTDLHDLSKQSMQEVRQIISNLTYRSLKDELTYLKEMFDLTKIRLDIINELELSLLSPILQSSLTMILRELTNNIIKHSQANSCQLILRRQGTYIVVEAVDDGLGFEQLTGKELQSIRERLVIVKGEVHIISHTKPTHIQVLLSEGVGL